MQARHLCVLIHIGTKGGVGTVNKMDKRWGWYREASLGPSVNIS